MWNLTHGSPSKPSRPSRAYLHLTNEAYLLSLSEVVQQAAFEDSLATFTNPCLIGPPTVEYAPYGRTPGGRRRLDARAGTIDQDPEFMAFLEGLANPTTTKEINAESMAEGGSAKQERVAITPLVQFLKDKKANKTKEAAVKLAKKQEAQLKNKSAKEPSSSIDDGRRKAKDIKVDKSVEKAAKEAVRILNREVVSKSIALQTAPSSEPATSQASTPPKLDVTKIPGRQRSAVVAAHIRMLQRDLGLTPAQAHRQVRRDTADAQRAERAAATAAADKVVGESREPSSSSQPQVVTGPPKLPPSQPRKPRGKGAATTVNSESSKNSSSTASSPALSAPVVLLRKPDAQQSTHITAPTTQPPKPSPAAPTSVARKPQSVAPASGPTQAFVKHANPSQGVTEALLKEAMEKFGAVSMVEIDKRKGFAYVDFVDADSLKKAMAANPVSVAQGTVQIMQRKGTALPPEKKPTHQQLQTPSRGNARGGRGGSVGRRGGRGRGGGAGPSDNRAPSTAPTGPAEK